MSAILFITVVKKGFEWTVRVGRGHSAKEEKEVQILSKYKPEQLNEEEVINKVKEAIESSGASSMQDMGKVMGILNSSLAGSDDMGMVSKIVKEELA